MQLPPWPTSVPRAFRPIAHFKHGIAAHRLLDALALQGARDLRDSGPRQSGLTTTWSELFFTNRVDFTAVSTTAAEASLLAGANEQPWLPAGFFDQNNRAGGRCVSLLARGVLGTTSTPTIIFQVRLGTTAGSASLAGTSVGVSTAITTAAGVTNQQWELRLDLICTVTGIGTNNTTLSGAGYVKSAGGFAAPYEYPLQPTTPPTGTWTATIDNSLAQYFNVSATWGTSSASNTITCKQLIAAALN